MGNMLKKSFSLHEKPSTNEPVTVERFKRNETLSDDGQGVIGSNNNNNESENMDNDKKGIKEETPAEVVVAITETQVSISEKSGDIADETAAAEAVPSLVS